MRVRFLRWSLSNALKLLSRLEVKGLENIPEAGPYILASNHMSRLDIPVLYSLIGGDHITAWVADKYRLHPIFGPIARLGNPIFIRRGMVDRNALDAAARALENGLVFALAPEGTRSRVGSLLRAKTGIAYIADQSDAPILLAALTGTDAMVRNWLRLRRPRVSVAFGQPFKLPPLDPQDRNGSLRRNADEVMCRLAAMLPPSYRGVYADHPRLTEFFHEP
jgi:1-acyl-sn-glycerol-3-phosphate acyltransferase